PAPPPASHMGRVLTRALHHHLNHLEFPNGRVVLGADPEFTIINRRTGRLVPASKYLSFNGRLGLDRQRLRGSRSTRPIGEVRPLPDAEPDRLVQQIHRLLLRLHRQIRRRSYHWIAGSGPDAYPTGGHIHISGSGLSAGLLRSLDVYLAIPFLLLEKTAKARRRRRRYGGLGDFRRKPWGFEYRTVPSWLVAPRYARAAFALTKLIARNWPGLKYDPFLDSNVQQAFYSCRKEVFYPIAQQLWSDLRQLPDYKNYAEHLEPLLQMIQAGTVWSESSDFRRQWGVLFRRRRRRRR
ncbi:MAG: hypothetical protein WD535_01325, partial [Thermaerobacterales bacterium]